MKNKELKMNLPSADDLFNNVAGKDIFDIERAIPIPINKLFEFPEHPFKIRDDEEMQLMSESIKSQGILHPLIVRPKADGNYEIISGHRRKRAGELANLKELPCIVRDLDDNQAVIEMVDTNMQREKILPSEKAFAYKMKLEAEKQQGKRNDLTSSQVGTKLETTSDQVGRKLEITGKIGKENGDSQTQVKRYIRLTELIPELLQLVDEERIAFTPAVDLSYLPEDYQYVVLNIFDYDEKTPNVSQAKTLKLLSQEGNLTAEKIEEIMEKPKVNQLEKFKIDKERIQSVLPKNIQTQKQTEDFIIQCIEEHNQRELARKKSHVR